MENKNESYFAEANRWAGDILDGERQRKRAAYWIAGLATVVAIAACAAVAALTPLKTVDGYVVAVDRHTGQVNTLTSLKANPNQVTDLTQDQALTKANLAAYVVRRETFDLVDIEERHQGTRLTSEKRLFDEYDRTFRGSASVNPFKLYENTVREIDVKSVEFFNDRTGQVRFRADLKKAGVVTETHWVAIIQYRYVQTPSTLKERLANPLGFQVTSYRVDEESQ